MEVAASMTHGECSFKTEAAQFAQAIVETKQMGALRRDKLFSWAGCANLSRSREVPQDNVEMRTYDRSSDAWFWPPPRDWAKEKPPDGRLAGRAAPAPRP